MNTPEKPKPLTAEELKEIRELVRVGDPRGFADMCGDDYDGDIMFDVACAQNDAARKLLTALDEVFNTHCPGCECAGFPERTLDIANQVVPQLKKRS